VTGPIYYALTLIEVFNGYLIDIYQGVLQYLIERGLFNAVVGAGEDHEP